MTSAIFVGVLECPRLCMFVCIHVFASLDQEQIHIVMDMDDDIRDDEAKNGILLGASLIWPSSLLIDTTFSIIYTFPPPTTNKPWDSKMVINV